jgi:LacI family transcriptional regulator
MASQRDIAEALGISQTTVSRALRGWPEITEEVRNQVIQTAKQMGYQPTMYANRLMSHIRSGKKLADRDTVALIVEARSLKEWTTVPSYGIFYDGICQKAFELGLQIETFFLKRPGMSTTKLDRILYTRGLHGIIVAPPYSSNRSLNLTWSRYAAVAIGFGREEQDLPRVVFDQLNNYVTAFGKLREMGYKRIGTVLTEWIINGNTQMCRWYMGYMDCQRRIPESERVPVFTSMGGRASPEEEANCAARFKEWMETWNPDAVLTMTSHEKQWLDAMQLRIPQDIGLAYLSNHGKENYSGIDEKSAEIGASALELVAAKIFHNEFGLPANPTTMMVHGCWVDGPTVRKQS